MMQKYATYLSGLLAVGVYVFLVGTLLFYFNTRHTDKPKHFVKKNEDSIRVSVSSFTDRPKTVTKKKVTLPKKINKHPKKVHKKPRVIKKKVVKKKIAKKKVLKKKIAKKKIIKKKTAIKKVIRKKIVRKNVKPKKITNKKITHKKTSSQKTVKKKSKSTKELFSKIKASRKKRTSTKKSSTQKKKKTTTSQLFKNIKTGKKSDRGIENRYFAQVEEKLKDWPAQSEYAGEEAKVWLKIKPNGHFTFKVLTASSSSHFNEGLIAYLKQLQRFGFGKHKGNRAYEINVEFVASE